MQPVHPAASLPSTYSRVSSSAGSSSIPPLAAVFVLIEYITEQKAPGTLSTCDIPYNTNPIGDRIPPGHWTPRTPTTHFARWQTPNPFSPALGLDVSARIEAATFPRNIKKLQSQPILHLSVPIECRRHSTHLHILYARILCARSRETVEVPCGMWPPTRLRVGLPWQRRRLRGDTRVSTYDTLGSRTPLFAA